ncbi:MAG TPA: XRE family transcriptional regulator [Lachnospiraceae bacterium]|nr:XRE family transcriptional regulator [Lachnospiraceae bacterium]
MEILGIGDRLRELRSGRNLSLKQVSDRLGIAVSSLSSYELNEKNPSYRNLLKLARLYGVSCDYLLGNDTHSALDVYGLTEQEIAAVAQIISFLKEGKQK